MYYAFVLCLCTMHFKNETQKRKLYYVELQNIMAQKNHVVLCQITKYELTLYYVGRNVLFFLFKSIDGLIFFFHSCAVFTIVLMIFPGVGQLYILPQYVVSCRPICPFMCCVSKFFLWKLLPQTLPSWGNL